MEKEEAHAANSSCSDACRPSAATDGNVRRLRLTDLMLLALAPAALILHRAVCRLSLPLAAVFRPNPP